MHVGIDVSVFGVPLEGIGHYTLRLLQSMSQCQDTPVLRAFSYGRNVPAMNRLGLSRLASRHWTMPGKMACLLWQTLRWPDVQRFTGPLDLFHVTNHTMPPLRGIPHVLTLYDLFFMKKTLRECTWEERRFRREMPNIVLSASRIICLSAFVAREVQERWKIPEDRIDLIPAGVDPVPDPEDVAMMEKRLQRLDVIPPYLLHVGHHGPRKNLGLLLDAFARLESRELHLILAGREGPATNPLRQACQRLGLEDRVHFLGYVLPEDLSALYQRATCFVFPSLEEGFGLPVLEAMAAGIPVVSAATGSLPEVVGDSAVLVRNNDSSTWASALEDVIENEGLRADLARKGKQRADQYSWETAARKTLQVYERCLA